MMYRKVRWHSAYFKNTIQILLNLYELLDVYMMCGCVYRKGGMRPVVQRDQ